MGQEFGQSVAGSSSSTDCHQVSVKAGVLSEGSAGEGSAPKLTWLLARLSTLQAVGLRASVPRWLLCTKSPSGPGGPLHKWDHNTATGFIRQQGESHILGLRSPSSFPTHSVRHCASLIPTLKCLSSLSPSTLNAKGQALSISLQNCLNSFLMGLSDPGGGGASKSLTTDSLGGRYSPDL